MIFKNEDANKAFERRRRAELYPSRNWDGDPSYACRQAFAAL
jgi:hypothetical protein